MMFLGLFWPTNNISSGTSPTSMKPTLFAKENNHLELEAEGNVQKHPYVSFLSLVEYCHYLMWGTVCLCKSLCSCNVVNVLFIYSLLVCKGHAVSLSPWQISRKFNCILLYFFHQIFSSCMLGYFFLHNLILFPLMRSWTLKIL